jgi:glycosyltransferase involved in cell wall biosynthesis
VTPSAEGIISVIVPFFNASAYLQNCLEALRRSDRCNYELILVNDGSTDSSAEVAGRFADRVLTFPSPRGPAFARNRGAEIAKGNILFFIDADVFCYPDTLAKVSQVFASRPDLSAVIGSYDDAPAASNFLSRYKNLTHHFVHQNSSSIASTFWTGCGAVKRDVFLKLHGFDESYRTPSIEDIELGCRLREQGYGIALSKHIVVKHAKIWSFRGLLSSDIRDRAIPWTILQLYHRNIINDLNVSWPQRAASIFTCLAVCLGFLSFWNPWCLAAAAALMIPVIGWNYKLYRFYYRKGGVWFCLRAMAMHWFYYVYSMLAFVTGCLKYLARHQRR